MNGARLRSLWRNWFRRNAVDADLDEEVQAYVEMAAEEKIAAGATAEEARRATLAEMGGAERLKQQVRAERAGTWLESVAQDLRFGLRQVTQSPAFGLTVLATLALSIGIATAVFSVLYAMVIRPLPYRDVSRIVALDTHSAGGGSQAASWPEYVDWRRMSRSFTAMAGLTQSTVGLEGGAGPVALREVQTTDNFFDVFGVNPIVGRTFAAGESQAGRNDIVVLSYEVWQQDFGGRASVVGQTVRLDGNRYTVIGVMPAGFRFPIQALNSIYVPLHLNPNQEKNRGNHWLQTVAKLKPGVTARQAEEDLDAIFGQLGKSDAFNAGRTVHAVDLTTWVVGDTRNALRLLLGAVLAVLVIGCVNVAGLLLARGVKREREIALRSAMGARRGRIVRQLVTEALVFAAAGAAGGVALAYGLLHVMRLLLIASLSRGAEVAVNVPVLAAAVGTSVAVTVAAALIPALRLSGTAPTTALKSGGSAGTSRAQHRLRTGFVVTQVALALALLVVSGLLLEMLERLHDTQLGFLPDHLLTAEIDLPHGRYAGRDVFADFYQPLLDRVRALPGVQTAGLIQMLPGTGWGWNSEHIHIYGTEPLKNPRTDPAEVRFVSPGYYPVFHDVLVEGRLADPRTDNSTTRVVCVVNQAFVKKFIPPGRDPVGMEIGDNDQTETMPTDKNPRILIIGVVKDLRQSIYQPPFPELDYMIAQIPAFESMDAVGSMNLAIRTSVDPESLVPALRQAFQQVDPTVPLREPQTMETLIADAMTFQRLENWLFGVFAALAVLLAVVGLYGLISHEVELSTREIGIRLALGAPRGVIVEAIFRHVGWMLSIGVVIGLAVTLAAERLINAVVAVQPERNAGLIAALALGLAIAGLVATVPPARRASAVEPMEALREE
ncbi:MAG TPA: ABC transporter permease [Acidobacteriaceae bacterium]|nr:ABC transporter permease [Acidobacteriaceae bacterium]